MDKFPKENNDNSPAKFFCCNSFVKLISSLFCRKKYTIGMAIAQCKKATINTSRSEIAIRFVTIFAIRVRNKKVNLLDVYKAVLWQRYYKNVEI